MLLSLLFMVMPVAISWKPSNTKEVSRLDNEKCNVEEEMRDIMTCLQNNEKLRHMIWIEIKNKGTIRVGENEENAIVNTPDYYR